MNITSIQDYERLSEEEKQKLREEAKKENDEYEIKHAEKVKRLNSLISEIINMGIPDYAEKYLRKKVHLLRRWNSDLNTIATWDMRIKEQHVEKQKKNNEDERTEAVIQLVVKAFKFLTEHNVPTDGLSSRQAIQKANEIRQEELIAEKLKAGVMFSFSGEDYCENCSGWDGERHRCECGNRRVYWEAEGDFPDMYIQAVAY